MLYSGQFYECVSGATQTLVAIADENGAIQNTVNFALQSKSISGDNIENPTIEVKTTIDGATKNIYVTNIWDNDIFIRTKAFVPIDYDFYMSNDNGNWSLGSDEYWYYSGIINPNQKTDILKMIIERNNITGEEVDATNTSIIIEATPVLYDENGNPFADWY